MQLEQINLGDITYLTDEGTINCILIKINNIPFLWGNSDDYAEEKILQVGEKLQDCVDIIKGEL